MFVDIWKQIVNFVTWIEIGTIEMSSIICFKGTGFQSVALYLDV